MNTHNSELSSGVWAAVDNGDPGAKRIVREAALASVHEPRVLDLFAGEGHMYRDCWYRAADYLGIEGRPIGGPGRRWIGDNRTLLGQAMRESEWNVVDLDAYSDPWIMLPLVVPLIQAQRFALTLTCAVIHGMRLSRFSTNVTRIMGLGGLQMPPQWLGPPLAIRWYEDFVRWALADAGAGRTWDVERVAQIRKRGGPGHVRYWLIIGVRLDDRRTAPGASPPPTPPA